MKLWRLNNSRRSADSHRAGLNLTCQRKEGILTGAFELRSARLCCGFTCQRIGRNCSTLSFDLFIWLSPEVFWFKANAHRLEFFSTGMPVILVPLGSSLWCRGVGFVFSMTAMSGLLARRVQNKESEKVKKKAHHQLFIQLIFGTGYWVIKSPKAAL